MTREAFVIHRECGLPYTQFRTYEMAKYYYGRHEGQYKIKTEEPRNPLPPMGYSGWCKCKNRL